MWLFIGNIIDIINIDVKRPGGPCIWGQNRFYWILININFIGTNIINIKDIPDVPCIWGQGRVCWGILKQRPPQKWSWLHGRFHPSPKNRIIYLRCCCSCCYCLYCSCVVVVVCTSSESQSTDIYTWAAGCFGFHLDCCCQLGHDFAIEKIYYLSLSAWILWKTVYILSEFYLGLWPLHLLENFLHLIWVFDLCTYLILSIFFVRVGLFPSFSLYIFFVFTWTSLSGSDHKRSQRRPVSGTSVGRMIRLK